MRVGDETRPWVQDEVLIFDDSFEHEVWNNCDSDRAVFQVNLSTTATIPPPHDHYVLSHVLPLTNSAIFD